MHLGNHDREMSEICGNENRTDGGSSIQIDLLQETNIPDFLKIEDQQRSSINSAQNRRGAPQQYLVYQSAASGGVKTNTTLRTAEFPM